MLLRIEFWLHSASQLWFSLWVLCGCSRALVSRWPRPRPQAGALAVAVPAAARLLTELPSVSPPLRAALGPDSCSVGIDE